VEDAHATGETRHRIQRLGGGAEFRRQVDARDLDAEFRGEPTRRAADAGRLLSCGFGSYF
jgi:hypothetical protein